MAAAGWAMIYLFLSVAAICLAVLKALNMYLCTRPDVSLDAFEAMQAQIEKLQNWKDKQAFRG